MTTETLELNGEGVFEVNEDGIFTTAGKAVDGFFSGIGDTVGEAWSAVGAFMDRHPSVKDTCKGILYVVAWGVGVYVLMLGMFAIGYWVGETLIYFAPTLAEAAPIAVTVV